MWRWVVYKNRFCNQSSLVWPEHPNFCYTLTHTAPWWKKITSTSVTLVKRCTPFNWCAHNYTHCVIKLRVKLDSDFWFPFHKCVASLEHPPCGISFASYHVQQLILVYFSGSTKEEMADSSQPSEGAELSLRPQGRKSIGESYIVQHHSLIRLVQISVGQSHHTVKINFLWQHDLRFGGKS